MQDLAHQLTYVIPIAIAIAFLFALWLARDVLGRETGTKEMVAVGDVIYEGAVAFMRRQYTTIMALAVVTAIILAVVIGFFDKFPEAEGVTPMQTGIFTGIAFLIGASLSALSGVIGMWVAVRSNVRVAAAARKGVGSALQVAQDGATDDDVAAAGGVATQQENARRRTLSPDAGAADDRDPRAGGRQLRSQERSPAMKP